ncbi:MAG TPA: AAA family ATPase, partial [Nocardioidaceae bacterium]|nr:AAA family ATPase [Nocardioidaceae bacterium]
MTRTSQVHDVSESLVGRAHELAELEDVLALAAAGRPTAVFVQGEPGSGRTALVDSWLGLHPDLTVLRSSGVSWEAGRPLGVLRHLLRGHDPDDVGRTLAHLGEAAPVVLVVDHAEHADVESVRVLASAVRWLHEVRVLLVLVTDLDGRVPASMRSTFAEVVAHRILLSGIDARAVQHLAARTGVHLSRPTAHRLVEHTRGRPGVVVELLRESGPALGKGVAGRLPAPRRVVAETDETLARLSSDARSVLGAAAVLGPDAPLAHVTALSRVSGAVAAVDEAESAGLVRVVDLEGLPAIGFPDPMVRAAVYELLGPAARHELHCRAAETVDDEGDRLDHRAAASPGPDADLASELVAFARRRAGEGVWADVADAMIKASRLSPDRADREERLLRGMDALVAVGDLPRAIATAPDVEGLRESALRDAVLGHLAILRGRPSEAEALLDRAWELANPERHPGTAALICQRRVLHSLGRWNGEAIIEWSDRARGLVEPSHPAAVEAMAITGLGLAASGEAASARAAYSGLRQSVHEGVQVQRFRMGQGWLDLASDSPSAARRELESAVPGDSNAGSVRISLWAWGWLARAQFVLGDWDDALDAVRRARILLEESELDLLRPLVHWTGAQIHALRDEPGPAAEHVRLGHADLHHYEVMVIPACLARAAVAETTPDYAAVVRALQPLTQLDGHGIHEPGFWPWHDVYANALVMTNRVDEADAFLTPHEELARDRGHRSAQART